MSKSFQIDNGDLVISSGRKFGTVTGSGKLAQDLRLWILEKIGTDPSTPTFGSRLDGGIIDGQEIQSYIGQIVNQQRVNEIVREVGNVVNKYQSTQLEKLKRDAVLYQGEQTLVPDEILHFINSIEGKAVGDIVAVQVNCTTLSGTIFKLTIPVQV
jgi:hypothetical protein